MAKRGRDRMSKWDGFTSGQNTPPVPAEKVQELRLRSVYKNLRSLARELETAANDLEELGPSSQSSTLLLGFSHRLAQDAVTLAELNGGHGQPLRKKG